MEYCTEKYSMAKTFSQSDVKKSGGFFEVKRSIGDGVVYEIDIKLPKCDCLSWKRTKLPCKHMFAVFLNSEESWTSLPEIYRDSVYMTLDKEVVGEISHSTNFKDDDIGPGEEPDHEFLTTQIELPMKRKITRTKFAECREVLKEIKALTFSAQESVSCTSIYLQYYYNKKFD